MGKKIKKIFNFYKTRQAEARALVYRLAGKKPWSKGYFEYKWKMIDKAVHDQSILAAFKEAKNLPAGYGYGLDERIVEYPWAISQLPEAAQRVLDAGSVFNFPEIIRYPKLANKNLTIATLSPESNCFWQKNISYVYTDLRQLPFQNDWFDSIVCLSTLEHIGMDNTMIYTDRSEFKEAKGDFAQALRELKRVLRSGGSLLLTVPFGQYENHRFFQQFDAEMINRVIDIFGGSAVQKFFYQYSKDGWQRVGEEDCQGTRYFDIHQTKKIEEDQAAAARAVACLVLTK